MTSRRGFLGLLAGLPLCAVGRRTIRDIRTMTLKGPSRTYVLVKVIADDGMYGIAEAYGTPAIGVKEQILSLKPWLVGKDPLEIDTLYTFLGEHTPDLSGTRTDGSAHELMRAASGIEMALWDLAGKMLGVPPPRCSAAGSASGCGFTITRRRATCWTRRRAGSGPQKVKADPAGFTATSSAFRTRIRSDRPRSGNRVLTTKELIQIRQGFENCREAIGWDHDIMVHCHWEYDLRTSIQIAEAVEPIKPMWLEDPLQVEYSESWRRLRGELAGADLHGREPGAAAGIQGFHHQPGLRHSASRPAQQRRISGDQTHRRHGAMCSACRWRRTIPAARCIPGRRASGPASIRDYMACETITGQGGWMDQLLVLDGSVHPGWVCGGDPRSRGSGSR